MNEIIQKQIQQEIQQQIQNQLKNQTHNTITERLWTSIPADINIFSPSTTIDVLNILNNLNDSYSSYNSNNSNNSNNSDTYSKILAEYQSKYINKNSIHNLIQQYTNPDNIVLSNNTTIIYYAMYLSITLLIISVGLIIAFKYVDPNAVNVTHILLENFITFSVIGVIEYWFFMTFIKEYIPSLPSQMNTSLNNNIKKQLSVKYNNNINNIPEYSKAPIPLKFS